MLRFLTLIYLPLFDASFDVNILALRTELSPTIAINY
jgi:hypothetical protein